MVDGSGEGEEDAEAGNRTIYFNVPIPETEKDEDGVVMFNYPRNKVRTAKYTPLNFAPKNIWLQFNNNIANVYFLFIVILGVSFLPTSPTKALS